MVNFFAGLSFTIFLYLNCHAVCFCIKKLIAKPHKKPAVQEEEAIPPHPVERVYYLTSPKKKAKKRPKSHVISLKGALMPKGTTVVASKEALRELKSLTPKPAKKTSAKTKGQIQPSAKSPAEKSGRKKSA